jgi:ABC-type Fe3+/spermidine/putrescine transport system ATPase subunit
MRAELRKIQKRTGVTFVYITHDQVEALTMSDRIGVISPHGILEQVDSSDALYNEPRTAFVAEFVGDNNAFAGTIRPRRWTVLMQRPGVAVQGRNLRARPRQRLCLCPTEAIRLQVQVKRKCDYLWVNLLGRLYYGFLKTGEAQTFVMRQNNDGSSPLVRIGATITAGSAQVIPCWQVEGGRMRRYGIKAASDSRVLFIR